MPRPRLTDPYSQRLGAYIKRIRKASGLTQEQVAERSDLSADSVRRLELACFSPSLTTLLKLAYGLGRTPAQLLTEFEGDLVTSGETALLTIYRRSEPRIREAMRASVVGLGQLSTGE